MHVDVPGYHLHFSTQDRKMGGHLLACKTKEITMGIHHTPEFPMAVPETTDFLTADLSRDTSAELNKAKNKHFALQIVMPIQEQPSVLAFWEISLQFSYSCIGASVENQY